MNRYLVIFTYVERAVDVAGSNRFILEAPTFQAAFSEAIRLSLDEAWILNNLCDGDAKDHAKDPDCYPIFDKGVDEVIVEPLERLLTQEPLVRVSAQETTIAPSTAPAGG